MEYQDVVFKKENGIGFIKLNRPELFNAMSIPMMEGVVAALDDCEKDDRIGAVILSGEGKAFCSGGDLKQMQENIKNIETIRVHLIDKVAEALIAMRKFSKPIIGQIHGAAAGGGCNFALSCDLRVASENAKFIESFVNVGLAPDSGGVYVLTRMVGACRAMELLMTGRPVPAQEALELGLVNSVVKNEALEEETIKLAKLLCSKPRESLRTIKLMMNRYMADRLDEELQYEKMFIRLLKRTADHKEGVDAFLEKRSPVFNKHL